MNDALPAESAESNLKRARQCLGLIRDIAARGALTQDPDRVGHALQELTQVLIERTGSQEIYFEPVPATLIEGLDKLYEELDFVNDCSQDLAHNDAAQQSVSAAE